MATRIDPAACRPSLGNGSEFKDAKARALADDRVSYPEALELVDLAWDHLKCSPTPGPDQAQYREEFAKLVPKVRDDAGRDEMARDRMESTFSSLASSAIVQPRAMEALIGYLQAPGNVRTSPLDAISAEGISLRSDDATDAYAILVPASASKLGVEGADNVEHLRRWVQSELNSLIAKEPTLKDLGADARVVMEK